MNTRLQAVADIKNRPVRLSVTVDQVSYHACAAARKKGLPEAEKLHADRGYDAD